MTTILTGLRTNSDYTIGNYIGALLPMIQTQNRLESTDSLYLFLPDLHSLEVDNNKTITENTIHNTKLFLAAGINPSLSNVTLFRQSQVPAHTQLQWLLTYFTYFGEASRMTQFKDKSSKRGETIPLSLFNYPVLMAADILLYDAKYIPVGEDQRQHLELARDLAIRINNKYSSKIFTVPETWEKQLEFFSSTSGSRIRSLTDPTKKMSKSEDNKSAISLVDTSELARKKIMNSTTDSIGMIEWNWDTQPGITNLLQIFQFLSHSTKEQTIIQWTGNTHYGELKTAVADLVGSFLQELQGRANTFTDSQVLEVLKAGEEKARSISNQKLLEFQNLLGL